MKKIDRKFLCKWINYKYLLLMVEESIIKTERQKNFLENKNRERCEMKKNIFTMYLYDNNTPTAIARYVGAGDRRLPVYTPVPEGWGNKIVQISEGE